MKHIDTHIHLYPEKLMTAIYRYFQRLGWHLPHRPEIADALSLFRDNEVEQAFLLLYAHKAGMSRELNHWAYELAGRHPQLIPFGCYFPDDSEPDELVRTCLHDYRFAGLKLHFNVQQYHPDDVRYFPVYRGVLEYGGGIVAHIGTFPNPGDSLGAGRLRNVLQRFPELKIIVAHMGFYQTEDFWRLMDRYPGVYLDTAFILGNPQFQETDHWVLSTLERFPDRVVYGSDFPLIRHRLESGLKYIADLPWEQNLRQNLMYDNAIGFLNHRP